MSFKCALQASQGFLGYGEIAICFNKKSSFQWRLGKGNPDNKNCNNQHLIHASMKPCFVSSTGVDVYCSTTVTKKHAFERMSHLDQITSEEHAAAQEMPHIREEMQRTYCSTDKIHTQHFCCQHHPFVPEEMEYWLQTDWKYIYINQYLVWFS